MCELLSAGYCGKLEHKATRVFTEASVCFDRSVWVRQSHISAAKFYHSILSPLLSSPLLLATPLHVRGEEMIVYSTPCQCQGMIMFANSFLYVNERLGTRMTQNKTHKHLIPHTFIFVRDIRGMHAIICVVICGIVKRGLKP